MPTPNQLRELAQSICDLFFEAGAKISKAHYDMVLAKLEEAKKEAAREREIELRTNGIVLSKEEYARREEDIIKEAVEGERGRIYKDLIERAEPYEGAKWLNTLTHNQIRDTVYPPHSKDEKLGK